MRAQPPRQHDWHDPPCNSFTGTSSISGSSISTTRLRVLAAHGLCARCRQRAGGGEGQHIARQGKPVLQCRSYTAAGDVSSCSSSSSSSSSMTHLRAPAVECKAPPGRGCGSKHRAAGRAGPSMQQMHGGGRRQQLQLQQLQDSPARTPQRATPVAKRPIPRRRELKRDAQQ